MAYGRNIYLLLLTLSVASAFSVSYTEHPRGRKLFGGYKIVPKVCQPTNPSRVKSNEPAICMFNYECTRRNGEVVGACMDGFLFGACCQLPPKQAGVDNLEKVQGSDDSLNVYEIDHVPEIPILLNPDGTPVGTSTSTFGMWSPIKPELSSNSVGGAFTKISTIAPPNGPPHSGPPQNTKDSSQNAEKPQINGQVNYANLEENFSNILGQQQVLDDLQLPGLLTHSDSNNDIQDHQDSALVSPVTTLLNPNQVLQIVDTVDQLPGLFSQGIASNNQSGPETILLSANGSTLDETHNPDEIFKPTTIVVSSTKQKWNQQTTLPVYNLSTSSPYKGPPNVISSSTTKKMTTKLPVITQKYAYTERLTATTPSLTSTNAFGESEKPLGDQNKGNSTTGVSDGKATASKVMSTFETTTPMSPGSNGNKDGLVRVPTIIYDAGNKKNDEFDREEIAINHIISILNDTTPSSETKYTAQGGHTASSIQTWVSIDETAKPSPLRLGSTRPSPTITTESLPYTYFKPGQSSNHYYQVPTEAPGTTSYLSSSSGGSSTYPSSNLPSYTSGTFQGSSLSTRPTINPPAPTVIVLGPLGTEYTTLASQKPKTTRRPLTTAKPTIRNNLGTKKPIVSTTITHNISTVISGATNNKHVVSTSYISVNLKDGTTTSVKPTTLNDSGLSTENAVVEDSSNSNYYVPSTKRPATVWTTISAWTNNKPSFHLKPSNPNYYSMSENDKLGDKDMVVPSTVTSTPTPCEDETAAPDDSIIFPPVRHPELNISNAVVQQEKPTIVIKGNDTDYPENFVVGDIPTPTFIEDDILKNKVDSFVNKIVDSLQGNFEDLKDVVYTKKNTTVPTPTKAPVPNKKPASSPTKKPKPTQVSTKKPVVVKKPTPVRPPIPVSGKPTILKPKPISGQTATTKKPLVVQKRPKPTKKTPILTSTEAVVAEQETTSETLEVTTKIPEVVPTSDFRKACGLRPHGKSGRIVGGKGATFGEWPWQVLVREATWLGLFTKNKCGGVLITDKYVITAAHCQPGFLASLVAVFGEHDISGELEPKRSVTRNVRRVVVNRGYDPATFENDLALLELETPIQFDSHIVPICMPDDGSDFTGQMATVTGWGRLKYNGGVPSVLQEVHVPIMENSVCQEMFQTAGHSKLILDSFLCAGYANGQKDSCEGDSGGPLAIQRSDGRWTLVGTVSHGIKCAAPYLPGVYMRTIYFKPWLHTITGV